MRRRNRITLFLVMPLVVFFWFLGWSLYWGGSKKISVKPRKRLESEELTLAVLMPEQKYAE